MAIEAWFTIIMASWCVGAFGTMFIVLCNNICEHDMMHQLYFTLFWPFALPCWLCYKAYQKIWPICYKTFIKMHHIIKKVF